MGKRTTKVLDKAIRTCDVNKISLPEISDTWNLISKFKLQYEKSGGKIVIDADEAIKKGVSPEYLKRISGFTKMYGRGDF